MGFNSGFKGLMSAHTKGTRCWTQTPGAVTSSPSDTSVGILIYTFRLHTSTSVREPHQGLSTETLPILILNLVLPESPQKHRAYISLYYARPSLHVSSCRVTCWAQ